MSFKLKGNGMSFCMRCETEIERVQREICGYCEECCQALREIEREASK